jgi:hypothetical protein
MTPVLLDQRTLFKTGITVSLGMLVVFVCGYYIGHQKAVSGGAIELNQTIALALPRPAHAQAEAFDPQLPQRPVPGANIDVDSPDSPAAGADAETVAPSPYAAGIDTAIKQTTDSIEGPLGDTGTETAAAPLQLASLEPAPPVLGAGPETGKPSAITDTASADDARYTIQVGVFADEGNALRRLAELESLQLSAYMTEYASKRDEIRYNVRFGYFSNKSSATAALDVFERDLSGSGYVATVRRN